MKQWHKREPENAHATVQALNRWGHVRLWGLLHYGGWFFSKDEAAVVREVGECIMASADSLAAKACEGGSSLWVLRPKHHMLLKIVNERCTSCRNPLWSWCFPDEDAVGRSSRLAKATHRTTMAAFQRAMIRYRLMCSAA